MNNVVHGKKIEMVVLKNGEKLNSINEVFKKLNAHRSSGCGSWGESKDHDGFFVCVGKGSYSARANHRFGKIFNEYCQNTGEIFEGYYRKDNTLFDDCPKGLFNNPLKHGEIRDDQISFDHRKEKRVYFTHEKSSKLLYIFRGVYKLKELRPSFKDNQYKVRVWTRISKDWEV